MPTHPLPLVPLSGIIPPLVGEVNASNVILAQMYCNQSLGVQQSRRIAHFRLVTDTRPLTQIAAPPPDPSAYSRSCEQPKRLQGVTQYSNI